MPAAVAVVAAARLAMAGAAEQVFAARWRPFAACPFLVWLVLAVYRVAIVVVVNAVAMAVVSEAVLAVVAPGPQLVEVDCCPVLGS